MAELRATFPKFSFGCLQQETFLQSRIKVDGKTNNFGDAITLERVKNKVTLVSERPFSKRSGSLLICNSILCPLETQVFHHLVCHFSSCVNFLKPLVMFALRNIVSFRISNVTFAIQCCFCVI